MEKSGNSGFNLSIDSDIAKAATLPAEFYREPRYYDATLEKIFARSWQYGADLDDLGVPGAVLPFTLLEGSLNEPLFFSRDMQDELRCLSNVCTHRGNILIERGGVEKSLRCRYHGRRFGLDGKFQSMPECEQACDFPSESDNLPRVRHEAFAKFAFVSLNPAIDFESLIAPVKARVGWLPFEDFRFEASLSRDYLVHSSWALYCDNFLEGFHIPYIHAGLNSALDYGSYSTEIFEYCNLQIGIARGAEETFELPAVSPDYGKKVAAYYFWLFPNTMLNFYPWGLSLNVVRPLGPDRCKVSFRAYVWREEKVGKGAGALLDRVEREDEAIVENVQRGVTSRLYTRGRFSPKQEKGTHHFHRLIAGFLNG